MKYKVNKMSLFDAPEDYYLAQCISADFGMGKGIAVEFNKRFGMKTRLIEKYPQFIIKWKNYHYIADCILEDKVFNLITKANYYHKPTYESLRVALVLMRYQAKEKGIKKIAMPKIGCGLDKLRWDKVEQIIKEVFADTDIEILVCYV